MASHDLLPTLMRVLDRADDEAELVRDATDRERLLALATTISPAHPVGRLEAAVDAELASMPSPPPTAPAPRSARPLQGVRKGARSVTVETFGWDRPDSDTDREERRVWTAAFGRKSLVGKALAMIGAAGLVHGLTYGFFSWAAHHADVGSPIQAHPDMSGWLALPFTAVGVAFVWAWVVWPYFENKKNRYDLERSEDYLDELPHPLTTYLAIPSCRAYLAAVLSSGLPRLLVRDAHELGDRYAAFKKAEWDRQEAIERPEREAKVRQQRLEAKQQVAEREQRKLQRAEERMAELAAHLAVAPEQPQA